ATVIALTGEYGRILDTVIPADWIFFGLSAACVFAFRRGAAPGPGGRPGAAAIPFHPLTTLAFIAVSGWIVVQSLLHDPRDGAMGPAVTFGPWPVSLLWRRFGGPRPSA